MTKAPRCPLRMKIPHVATGAESSTSCCLASRTRWDLATCGDSRTCVTGMAEVRYTADLDPLLTPPKKLGY